MCTAISFLTKDHYFGRNLDLEYHFHETVTITPRRFPLLFRKGPALKNHYAIIGMATVASNYPLYYDATNECGLSMAGLNFPGNAVYYQEASCLQNISPFELIPWILAQCSTVAEALEMLQDVNIIQLPFNQDFPLTPLHWLISDRCRSITVEPMISGLQIHENPIGVLANNPPFDYHMHNLANYLNLTNKTPSNLFANQIDLVPYSNGMGGIGLPGDLSSASRFVRAAFTKLNSVCGYDELSSISQFFHILGSVMQQNGCCVTKNGYEKTIYSSCCNTDRGIYYYRMYNNSQINAVDMHKIDMNTDCLHNFELITEQQIRFCN